MVEDRCDKIKVVDSPVVFPKGLLAQMHIDDQDPVTLETISLLRSSGFIVLATSVHGLYEPRVTIGEQRYEGIDAIRAYVEGLKNRLIEPSPSTE